MTWLGTNLNKSEARSFKIVYGRTTCLSSFGKGHSPNSDFFFLLIQAQKGENGAGISMAKSKTKKQDMTYLGKFTDFQAEKDAKLHYILDKSNEERPNLKI